MNIEIPVGDTFEVIQKRMEIAKDENTPSEVLKDLADVGGWCVVEQILKNRNCPLDLIEKFRNTVAREIIAGSPATPVRILEEIAEESFDYMTAEALAANLNTPDKVLRKIAKIPVRSHIWFRTAVDMARKRLEEKKNEKRRLEEEKFNSMSKEEQMMSIAKSNKNQLKVNMILKTKDLTEEVMDVLSKDKSDEVRSVLAEREGIPDSVVETLLNDKSMFVRKSLLNNKSLDGSVIERLSKDEHPLVRTAVASCKRTPSEILDSLVGDLSTRVRAAIIRNPNATKEALEKLRKSNPELFILEGE